MQTAAQINLERQRYKKMVEEVSPNSKTLANCFKAFWTGGTVCVLGQLFIAFFSARGYTFEKSATAASVLLVLITAVLTGFGVYDKLGKYAGAGTIVPITGFANSMVAPAMEFKKEGFVFGVGAKLFVVAGPVIVYGVASSAIIGLLYYIAIFFMK